MIKRKIPMPILIVYKKGDFYAPAIEMIKEILESAGIKTKIHQFSSDILQKEIEDWWENMALKMKNCSFLTSGIAKEAMYRSLEKVFGGELERYSEQKEEFYKMCSDRKLDFSSHISHFGYDYETVYLEYIIEKAACEAFFGVGASEEIFSVSCSSASTKKTLDKYLVFLLKKILENKKNQPKKIYIVSEKMKRLQVLKSMHIDPKKGKMEIDVEGKEQEDQEVAKEAKLFFLEAGIPEKKTKIISQISENDIEKISQKSNWIITAPRNINPIFVESEQKDGPNYIAKLKIGEAWHFILTMDNFFCAARKLDLIKIEDLDPEKLKQGLKKSLWEETLYIGEIGHTPLGRIFEKMEGLEAVKQK